MKKQVVLDEAEYEELLKKVEESKCKVPYDDWHTCSNKLGMYITLFEAEKVKASEAEQRYHDLALASYATARNYEDQIVALRKKMNAKIVALEIELDKERYNK